MMNMNETSAVLQICYHWNIKKF